MYNSYLILYGSIALSLLIGILIIFINYKREHRQEYKDKIYKEYLEEARAKYSEEYRADIEKLNELRTSIAQITQNLNDSHQIAQKLDSAIAEKTKLNNNLIAKQKADTDQYMEMYRSREKERILREVHEWEASAQEAADFRNELAKASFASKQEVLQGEIDKLCIELSNFQAKRDAINEEILRSRAVEEQQEFYRIQIPDASKADLQILAEIRPRLSKLDNLDNLIYSNYINKPVKEMTKRVLAGRDPSGIYKVTNIKTNEIYIGKSVTCATRWSNHCKSAYNLTGVADSMFQRALKRYGIDAFTWELLEEVPKDKLTEREHYYINFYNTTKYGYNMREG